MRTQAALFLFLVFVGAGEGAAHAHGRSTYELKGDQLVVGGPDGFTTSVSTECKGTAYLEHEDKVYVACGRAGVAIVSVADPEHPVLESRLASDDDDDDTVSFFVAEAEVWVRMKSAVARPVSSLGARSEPPKPKPKPGTHATFEPQKRARRLGGQDESCRDDSDCEGHLRCIDEVCKRSGDDAPTKPSGPDIYGVDRYNGFAASFGAYAWIPGATAGFGLMLDTSLVYRFALPIAIHLDLSPLGLTWADLGNILATSYAGVIALDTRYFEIGVGPGVQTLNSRDGPQPSALVSFHSRIGSADGLSFWIRTDLCFVSRRDTSKWDLGATSGGIRIPISERWALLLRGGGGNAGWGRGELATQFRAFGDGKRRTIFLTLGIGGAASFLSANSVTYGGPALGGGIEWRP